MKSETTPLGANRAVRTWADDGASMRIVTEGTGEESGARQSRVAESNTITRTVLPSNLTAASAGVHGGNSCIVAARKPR